MFSFISIIRQIMATYRGKDIAFYGIMIYVNNFNV